MMGKRTGVARVRWALLFVIAFLSAPSATAFAEECSFLRKFGGDGSGAGQLSGPRGTAIDSKGDVWVADTGHNRIQEFNSKGEFLAQFSGLGGVSGIDVDSSDNIFVIGSENVRKFNSKGELLLSFGTFGIGSGQFVTPKGIAVDSSGNIWTIDNGGLGLKSTRRVQKFNSKGEYLSQFGEEGTGNSQFKSPGGIAVDSEGNVLVADTGNNRIQEFNSAGEFVRKYGSLGTGNGQFTEPQGVAVDSEGKVWVADTGNNRIQRFSSKGAYLSQFGSSGPNDGQFSVPQGLTTDSESHVWVADTGNNRVQEVLCK